ncbi:MAG TPA: ferrous iron transport protein A [Fimbriimonadaceae bacterium]|nr:ferrous iron transport protein A [Fimbriimonadaceae bacterium]
MEPKFGFGELKKGMKARVSSVEGSRPDTVRLMELGLTPGTEFTVTKIAPLGDPIEISVRGYRLCLRRKESTDIRLELVE